MRIWFNNHKSTYIKDNEPQPNSTPQNNFQDGLPPNMIPLNLDLRARQPHPNLQSDFQNSLPLIILSPILNPMTYQPIMFLVTGPSLY